MAHETEKSKLQLAKALLIAAFFAFLAGWACGHNLGYAHGVRDGELHSWTIICGGQSTGENKGTMIQINP